jgi:hypothetical protein
LAGHRTVPLARVNGLPGAGVLLAAQSTALTSAFNIIRR